MPLKERHSRLKAIRKLIKNHRVESQETLLSYLQKEGYEVTQATLSRDLKMLKVGKVSDGNAGYFYTLPSDEEIKNQNKSTNETFYAAMLASIGVATLS